LPSGPVTMALAGTGDVQDDDDYRHEEHGDCRWGYCAHPVEAGGWRGRGKRDFQAHARQDFLSEPAIVVLGSWVAESVRDGQCGE